MVYNYNMKRRGIIVSSILVLFILGAVGTQPSDNKVGTVNNSYDSQTVTDLLSEPKDEIETPVCDGKIITTDCVSEGIEYSKYIYHEAIIEKSHNETITNYRE